MRVVIKNSLCAEGTASNQAEDSWLVTSCCCLCNPACPMKPRS